MPRTVPRRPRRTAMWHTPTTPLHLHRCTNTGVERLTRACRPAVRYRDLRERVSPPRDAIGERGALGGGRARARVRFLPFFFYESLARLISTSGVAPEGELCRSSDHSVRLARLAAPGKSAASATFHARLLDSSTRSLAPRS